MPSDIKSTKSTSEDESESINDTVRDLRQQYYDVMAGKVLVFNFYEILTQFIRKLLSKQSIIGRSNIESFNNLLINLSAYGEQLKASDEIGDKEQAAILKRHLMSVSNQIITKIEELNLSGKLSVAIPTTVKPEEIENPNNQSSLLSVLSKRTKLLLILGGIVVTAIIIAIITSGIIKFFPPMSPSNDQPVLSISEANVVGSKVTITGQALSQSKGGNITKIHFDWADGNRDDTPSMPLSHNYVKSGIYSIKITAYDSNKLSTTKIVQVKVVTPPSRYFNHLPISNSGSNQIVNENTAVKLNGSRSYGPDGNMASYSWVQTKGPHVTLNHTNTATPSFITPSNITSDTLLTFKLTTTDKEGTSNISITNVTVKPRCQYIICVP